MSKSNLVTHAKYELSRAGLFDATSSYNGLLGRAALELIKKLSRQGHSGYSSRCVLDIFDKLSRFQPLTPLTGEDSEWVEVEKNLLQNRRCPQVFKTPTAGAWDTAGKEHITFPYTPGAEEYTSNE